MQDAAHFFLECGKTQHIRMEVDRELVRIVEASCGDGVVAAWKAMSPVQRSEKVFVVEVQLFFGGGEGYEEPHG